MSNIGDCNILTEGLDTEVIINGNFEALAPDLKVIQFAKLDGANLNLLDASGGGSESGSTWVTRKQRLSDGFLFKLKFNIADGGEDGVAFVIQNDRIQDIGGGGGENLGFKNKLRRSLAVIVDTCVERANDPNCNAEKVSLIIQGSDDSTATTLAEVETDAASALNFAIKGSDADLEVAYLANIGENGSVVVRINEQELLNQELPVSLLELFEDEFAFIGFSASNGAASSASVILKDFSFDQMNSGTLLSAESLIPQANVPINSAVSFELILVDSCNDPLPGDSEVVQNFDPASISAVLTSTDLPNEKTLVGAVNSDGTSTFTLTFALEGDISKWDLTVQVDGILTQKNPVRNIIDTTLPDAGGLSPLGIGLLAAALIIGVIGALLIVRGLDRYRKKLNAHKDDIEHGKIKAELDQIDTTIAYENNPMVRPLDELRETLAKNLKTIEELKARQNEAMDSDYEISQLQQENEALRSELNDLKKKQEYDHAGNRISTNFGTRALGRGNQNRQDFDQERA